MSNVENMIKDLLKSKMSDVDIEIHFNKETGNSRTVVKGEKASVMLMIEILVSNVLWLCSGKDVDKGKKFCITMMNEVFHELERKGNDDSV